MSYCGDKRGWCGRKAECRDHFCEGHPLNDLSRDEPLAPETPLAVVAFLVIVAAVLAIVQPDFSPLLQWVGEVFQKGLG